jgi:predicted dehydrogenase
MDQIRVGIVGLGANARLHHVPRLRGCENVEIVGVCNRRPESTRVAADEFAISKTYQRWEELVIDRDIDAIVVGTWPYLHCPITVAALEAGKHVLTEARMARNADEARQMFAASQQHPELITQIVPSPIGLVVDRVVKKLIADGFIGELREAVVLGTNDAAADPDAPLHWRQSASLSGINMLALGILHETLIRWIPDPVRVLAQTHTFTPRRHDPTTGQPAEVGTPDAVRVLTEIPGGAIGLYHLSGVMRHGPGIQIQLYGSEGTLKYEFTPAERLLGARTGDEKLKVIEIPSDMAGGWRVEEEFINAIRGIEKVQFTDFATGVRYMQFTEAVAHSAAAGALTDVSWASGTSA